MVLSAADHFIVALPNFPCHHLKATGDQFFSGSLLMSYSYDG
jgi:hypothetical protein